MVVGSCCSFVGRAGTMMYLEWLSCCLWWCDASAPMCNHLMAAEGGLGLLLEWCRILLEGSATAAGFALVLLSGGAAPSLCIRYLSVLRTDAIWEVHCDYDANCIGFVEPWSQGVFCAAATRFSIADGGTDCLAMPL
ncbi:hypothetical protein Nepgr_023939 [Nepenthes gracilis]|uniref:Uncharacterized protein n=1 Tax=Nepenthes gracilis TaxID=150966 RepID=A0AAD3XZZ1_NEPGR|nr:hypothetical protein Nepgr_023939 [Nepenthes gracilis]